jgi:hypothetical protein
MNRVSKTEVFEKYNSTHLQLKQSKNYQKLLPYADGAK